MIPTPVKCIFKNSPDCGTRNNIDQPVGNSIRDEQGTLAYGRNIVQGLKKKIGEFSRSFGLNVGINIEISNITRGLDCNTTIVNNGIAEDFKTKLRAIFPGKLGIM